MLKSYLVICLSIFNFALVAQEIISLPITEKDDGVKWENKEKQFYSDIWQTEVVSNVSKPTMQVFRPEPAKNTGAAVVICPGGGLYGLSINSEGNDVAKWLAERGVTSFVLKYRLVPTGADATKDLMTDGERVLLKAGNLLPLSISDGLNAIEYVRTNADAYGINKDKIGIMGFSAGGSVTMGVTYNYEPKNKPNFIVPVYAWMNILPMAETPKDAGPIFVVCASDDPLLLAPASLDIYTAWLKAQKSAALHMYAKGGHGFGMRKQNLPSDTWIERFGEWLETEGFLE
ncbi:MAG: alpha/beta hydrolase [Bacteroidota bacterium]